MSSLRTFRLFLAFLLPAFASENALAVQCFLTANDVLVNGESSETNLKIDVQVSEAEVKKMDDKELTFLQMEFLPQVLQPVHNILGALGHSEMGKPFDGNKPKTITIQIVNGQFFINNARVIDKDSVSPETLRRVLIRNFYAGSKGLAEQKFASKVNINFGIKVEQPRDPYAYSNEALGIAYLVKHYVGNFRQVPELKEAKNFVNNLGFYDFENDIEHDGRIVSSGKEDFWVSLNKEAASIASQYKDLDQRRAAFLGLFLPHFERLMRENEAYRKFESLPEDHTSRTALKLAGMVESRFDEHFAISHARSAHKLFTTWLEGLAESRAEEFRTHSPTPMNHATLSLPDSYKTREEKVYPLTWGLFLKLQKVSAERMAKIERAFLTALEALPERLQTEVAKDFPQPDADIVNAIYRADTLDVISARLLIRKLEKYEEEVNAYMKDEAAINKKVDKILYDLFDRWLKSI